MTETNRNIAVGLTALASLICLAAMLVLFGYVPKWLEEGYEVTVITSSGAGIYPGTRCTLSGIDIGQVVSVELDTESGNGVKLRCKIKDAYTLPMPLEVEVKTTIVGGSTTIAFAPLPPLTGTLATDGSALLTARTDDPLKTFISLSEKISGLADSWKMVADNLAKLTDSEVGDTPNLASVMARADTMLAEVQETVASIRRYVDDEKLHGNITQTAANIRNLTDTLEERVDALTKRYIALADDMSATVASAKDAIDQARDGDGTAGKFLNDPALYNNLNDAAVRLQQTLDEVKLLIQKFKDEGIELQL